MPSEQKPLFFDEKQTTLRKDYDVKNEIVDTIRSVPRPKISESSFHYELKNVKIDLHSESHNPYFSHLHLLPI